MCAADRAWPPPPFEGLLARGRPSIFGGTRSDFRVASDSLQSRLLLRVIDVFQHSVQKGAEIHACEG